MHINDRLNTYIVPLNLKCKIIENDNLLKIFNICDDAKMRHEKTAIISPDGFGKTTSLIYYKKKYKENVVLIKAIKGTNAIDFFSTLKCSVNDGYLYRQSNLHQAIISTAMSFQSKKDNMLLIIDDAHFFTPVQLEYLHDFISYINNNTGIVFSGNLHFKLQQEKWIKNAVSGIPEFYSRINNFHELKTPPLRII